MRPEIKKILKKLFWQVLTLIFLLGLTGIFSFIVSDPNLQQIAKEVGYYFLILFLIIGIPLSLIFFTIIYKK